MSESFLKLFLCSFLSKTDWCLGGGLWIVVLSLWFSVSFLEWKLKSALPVSQTGWYIFISFSLNKKLFGIRQSLILSKYYFLFKVPIRYKVYLYQYQSMSSRVKWTYKVALCLLLISLHNTGPLRRRNHSINGKSRL